MACTRADRIPKVMHHGLRDISPEGVFPYLYDKKFAPPKFFIRSLAWLTIKPNLALGWTCRSGCGG